MKIADMQNLVDRLCDQIAQLGSDTADGLPGSFQELAAQLALMGKQEASAACLKAAELSGQVSREETEASHGRQALAKTLEEVRSCLADEGAPPDVEPSSPAEAAGDDQLVQEFVEEASEHLAGFAQLLEKLAQDPRDGAALAGVIRGCHTIMGMAGYVDLDRIKTLARRTRELLDMARNQEITLDGDRLQLVRDALAGLRSLIQEVATAGTDQGESGSAQDLPDLLRRLEEMIGQQDPKRTAAARSGTKRQERPDAPAEVEARPGQGRTRSIKEIRGIAPDIAARIQPTILGQQPGIGAVRPPAGGAPDLMKQPVRERGPQDLIQIRAERLDKLVEAIGELVMAESLLSQSEDLPRDRIPVSLAEDLENLGRACRRLQQIGTSLELVPIEPLGREMMDLVDRLAARYGKNVELVAEGLQAELDQRLLARLREPLTLILTACLQEGIESSEEERIRRGKPGRAQLRLIARPRKDHLTLEIQDDGTGRNESIGADPGVRRALEKMQGTIAVAAERGNGCKFILRLPLNPNLAEGLVIKVGSERCILPAHAVLRLIRPQKKNLVRVFNRSEMVFFEGEALPLVSLGRFFGSQASDPDPSRAMVIVAEAEGRRIGLLAEELLGYQPIVVKKLSQTGRSSKAAAGAAVTTDGGMALVLDVSYLVRMTLEQESAEAGPLPVGAGRSEGV